MTSFCLHTCTLKLFETVSTLKGKNLLLEKQSFFKRKEEIKKKENKNRVAFRRLSPVSTEVGSEKFQHCLFLLF